MEWPPPVRYLAAIGIHLGCTKEQKVLGTASSLVSTSLGLWTKDGSSPSQVHYFQVYFEVFFELDGWQNR